MAKVNGKIYGYNNGTVGVKEYMDFNTFMVDVEKLKDMGIKKGQVRIYWLGVRYAF